jgi:hypothetical protein
MTQIPAVERHPWNTEFTWVDRTGPFRRLTQQQAEQFDRDGLVVLDAVFSDDELASVIAATDEVEARTDAFLGGQDGGRFSIAEQGAITFALFPVQSHAAARSFAAHPVFADLCHDLVGGRPVAVEPLC